MAPEEEKEEEGREGRPVEDGMEGTVDL